MKKLTLIFLMALLLSTIDYGLSTSYAAIPKLVNYQGRLTDSQGQPITGTKSVTFRIYDVESGGSPLWQETHTTTFDRGIFNVMIGGVTALNLAFDKQYYLGIQVGSDAEMAPRQRLASVGYAIRAENANNITGVIPIANGGTGSTFTTYCNLISNVTGILPILNGGTGVANKIISIVTYTGNGSDNHTVAHALGATPDLVIVLGTNKDYSYPMIVRHSAMAANYSIELDDNSWTADRIKNFDGTNVTLGASNCVNRNGILYMLVAVKSQ